MTDGIQEARRLSLSLMRMMVEVDDLRNERDSLAQQLSDSRALVVAEVGEYERMLGEIKALRPVVAAAHRWAHSSIRNGGEVALIQAVQAVPPDVLRDVMDFMKRIES